MNIKEIPAFQDVLQWTRDKGESMAGELSLVLDRMGFDNKSITQNGVVCTNVGDGPEIAAFSRLSPRVFIVSEPVTRSNSYTADEPIKEEVLNELIGGRAITLVRGYPSKAFQEAARINARPALVTNLNILPGTLHYGFVEGAMEILAPEGLVLLSAGERYDGELMELANKHFPHNKSRLVVKSEMGIVGVSGSAFLGIFNAPI